MQEKVRNFREMLEERWSHGRFVCVGLDTNPDKIPSVVRREGSDSWGFVGFTRAIVEATKDFVCAYKFNSAFYEAHGVGGLMGLRDSINLTQVIAPKVPIILDAKRADIDNTNAGYVSMAYNILNADAITVHPYLGAEALKPFLDKKDKGVIVLCRTSNAGAGEFQDLMCDGLPLYRHVARRVAKHWNRNGNCAVVAGATYLPELQHIREDVGDLPILIPGVGAQGASAADVVHVGRRADGRGMIINSSRGVIYASSGADFAQAARAEADRLHREIQSSL